MKKCTNTYLRIELDTNTILLNTPVPIPTAQLWRVVHGFHMGEWVRELLERRHINVSSLAEAMKVTRGAFQSYFKATVISDKVLREMTKAIGFDLYSMVKEEQARRTLGTEVKKEEKESVVSEPVARYGHVRQGGHDAWLMTLNMDDFDQAEQMKIVRFLQQLPRKGAQGKATG